jgi:ABC-type transport system involved in multi-copper enzyme maturation permease subunit
MAWARLAFRLQRGSIGFAAVVCLGLTALAVWLTLSLPSQLEECASAAAPHDCGVVSLFGSPLGDPALLFSLGIGVAMYGVPMVLGVPVLSSEIERRTAMIAWPLAGSRLKWLVWRAGSVLVIGLVLVGIMAAGAEALTRVNHPGGDPGFASHGARGISMLLRSTLMLVVAIAVGAVVGRLLPSLLIGIALAVGLSMAVDLLPPYGIASTELTPSEISGYHLTTGVGYRAPDGTPISEDEANAIGQAAYAEYSPDFPPDSVLPYTVGYGVAGSRYFDALAREAGVLIGATVLAGGLAAVVVSRRRPE